MAVNLLRWKATDDGIELVYAWPASVRAPGEAATTLNTHGVSFAAIHQRQRLYGLGVGQAIVEIVAEALASLAPGFDSSTHPTHAQRAAAKAAAGGLVGFTAAATAVPAMTAERRAQIDATLQRVPAALLASLRG
jgi:hypothetical protein